jgi:hypothetical protein
MNRFLSAILIDGLIGRLWMKVTEILAGEQRINGFPSLFGGAENDRYLVR